MSLLKKIPKKKKRKKEKHRLTSFRVKLILHKAPPPLSESAWDESLVTYQRNTKSINKNQPVMARLGPEELNVSLSPPTGRPSGEPQRL